MKQTIHTSRTIMYAELSEVMNFYEEGSDYFSIMEDNVFSKRTASSKKKTIKYLTQLYGFDHDNEHFRAFEAYWDKASEDSRPLLTFIYALSRDYLLQESVRLVKGVPYDQKAFVEDFEANISRHHPERFTHKTLRSVAQNLASSWKQGGYVQGKIKSIRRQNPPDYLTTAFAFLMAYLDGLRGDFMLNHICVQCLDARREELLALLKSAADRDLLQYKHSGATMMVTFDKFTNAVENV